MSSRVPYECDGCGDVKMMSGPGMRPVGWRRMTVFNPGMATLEKWRLCPKCIRSEKHERAGSDDPDEDDDDLDSDD